MKRFVILAVALITATLATIPATAQVRSYKDIQAPNLNDFQMPVVEKVTLKNGMRLFLVEDPELPLINMSARIRVGSAYDPVDKLGLAQMTGEVMRTGGTKSLTGDELDDLLEGMAAFVETNIGLTSGSAFMSVLKEDAEAGMRIFADVLRNPEFRQDKIDLAMTEGKSLIARRNDEPNSVVAREFNKVIYDADSPYARHPEYATIEGITREDLIAFHQKFYHPNNIMLAVWGDFKAADMIRKIEATFSDWQAQEPLGIPDLPDVNYGFSTENHIIERTDATQSVIRLGHIGIKQDNPDYFAVIVMNRVLGAGGFSSRLFKNVRSRKGLAYAVGGGIQANIEYPGRFQIICSTKSETTAEAIRAIHDEIRRMVDEPVTAEELALAKESYLNAFVFNFDTKSEIVNRIMAYDYYGYPEDFLQMTKNNVERVTVEDVQRVAKKYLHPDALRMVVLGNPPDFDAPLEEFGLVAALDITIPEPGMEQLSEATAEDMDRGGEVFASMVKAIGGTAAAKSIDNLEVNANLGLSMAGQQMELTGVMTYVYPERFAMKMNTPMGEITQVYDAGTGWAVTPGGTQDMSDSDIKDARASLFRDWVNILRNAASLEARYVGEEVVDGTTTDVIAITDAQGLTTKIYVNPKDSMPLMQAYRGSTMMGPAAMEAKYSMWKDVGGVLLPQKVKVTADGQEYLTMRVTSAKFNAELDKALFDK